MSAKLVPMVPVLLISAKAFAAKLSAMRNARFCAWPLDGDDEREVALTSALGGEGKGGGEAPPTAPTPSTNVAVAPRIADRVEYVDVDAMTDDSSTTPMKQTDDRAAQLKQCSNTVVNLLVCDDDDDATKAQRRLQVGSTRAKAATNKTKVVKRSRAKGTETGVKRARVLDDFFTRR